MSIPLMVTALMQKLLILCMENLSALKLHPLLMWLHVVWLAGLLTWQKVVGQYWMRYV
ncbi:Uncharacterised protein [Mycobacteroides abscessus subsp. abscessus]|nr:Uncharacterised protein [Mycobacteroides abscessus subsp. abscessus]